MLTLAPPYGAGDARIAELRVREGDRVDKGAILAVLDSERPFLASLESARATVAAREASLRQVRASMSPDARRRVPSSRGLKPRRRTHSGNSNGPKPCGQRGITADQSFEQKRTQRDETQREVERARATLSRYGAGDIADQPDVVVAARTLASAEADLARTAADLEKAYVRAPVAGTVLSIAAYPGEKRALRAF